ncbi:hypothetical protein EVAR_45988_1 [Eumeta japonica]|uniref:Uncharacterized protein n=1 Tax=Eumeta variegata TaxID=151549 RepID=A0A4C1X9A3_EUMVA|nr:hypothetical protein EVAR_45988_1 [Eumeta japonica]
MECIAVLQNPCDLQRRRIGALLSNKVGEGFRAGPHRIFQSLLSRRPAGFARGLEIKRVQPPARSRNCDPRAHRSAGIKRCSC